MRSVADHVMAPEIISICVCILFSLAQPLSALSLGERPLSATDIAIGVVSGGPNTAEKVAALRSTWLADFPNAVVMADVELEDLHVVTPPSKYYCSPAAREERGKRWGNDDEAAWSARGRCTQQRFLYLLLDLREKYPTASYYILIDDDTWVNSAGLKKMLSKQNPKAPFLMGHIPPQYKGFLWSGPGFVFSSELATRLATTPGTLMDAGSLWEFSCSFRGCCDFEDCRPDEHPDIMQDFKKCNKQLMESCPNFESWSTEENLTSCIAELEKTIAENPSTMLKNCSHEMLVPEYPFPMYYQPEWIEHTKESDKYSPSTRVQLRWGQQHGCDHVLSLAARLTGADLLPQPGFQWKNEGFPESFQTALLDQKWKSDPCNEFLAQHQLSPEEVVEWDRKWKVTCRNAKLPWQRQPGA